MTTYTSPYPNSRATETPFEDALHALRIAHHNLTDAPSEREQQARAQLIDLCAGMLTEAGIAISEDEVEHAINELQLDPMAYGKLVCTDPL